MEQDYYEILGLTEEDKKLPFDDFLKKLKDIFRKASLQYHPDRLVNKSEKEREEAEAKFKKISEAYNVLSDKDKKAEYDNKQNPFQGFDSSFFRGFHGFGDMFENEQRKGEDVKNFIKITLEESLNGCSRNLEYYIKTVCKHCNGTGDKNKINHKCPHCNGTGMISETIRTPFGFETHSGYCHHCNGTGRISNINAEDICPTCQGSGYEIVKKILPINIPVGIPNGAVLNIQGAGNEIIDGIPGNLLIKVMVENDTNFQINEQTGDIYTTLDVTLKDIVLGATKEIKCPNGSVKTFNIDEMYDISKKLRIVGMGIPANNYHINNGSLYITLRLKDKKLTSKQKELFNKIYD